MDWTTLLGGAASVTQVALGAATVTNAAIDVASYVGDVAKSGISNPTPIVPVAGTPTATPIGVYSVKQMNDAAVNGQKLPVATSATPAWVKPALIGGAALAGVWLLTRKR